MAGKVIRVSADSVVRYGGAANANFDAVQAALGALVNDTVGVHYFGPNAYQFKKQAGLMASTFAKTMNGFLVQIGAAVNQATSSIAMSLGGQNVNINLETAETFTPAEPEQGEDGVVDVDTSALEGLTAVVQAHFASIEAELDAHGRSLEATDWAGNAKDTVVTTVQGITATAKSKATEAMDQLVKFITDQVTAAQTADTSVTA